MMQDANALDIYYVYVPSSLPQVQTNTHNLSYFG